MRFSALTAQPLPWKNGGGVTRELASHAVDGKLAWRLSLADITRNGPFSVFPGLARIHCIVEGAGHTLSNETTRLEARPLEPLCFDGGADLDCLLRDGPCRAFNVIYDPEKVTAEPRVLAEGPVPDAEGRQVLFVVSGSLDMAGTNRLGPGEGVVTESAANALVTGGGAVVQVRFFSCLETAQQFLDCHLVACNHAVPSDMAALLNHMTTGAPDIRDGVIACRKTDAVQQLF